jgi:ABC-type multidrug transport system ATPase subunit
LVFDEPTSSLDPSSAEAVHHSLRELADDFLLFLVAHDPHSLLLCTHVLVVIDGGQDFFGPVELARRESSYVRGLAIDGRADEPGRLR